MTDHCEPIDSQMIRQLINVVGAALIAASGIERAETITGSIYCDEPYTVTGRGLAHAREVVTASRRSMKRDDRSTVTIAELPPGKLTTIRRKLKHTRRGHGAYCPE